MSSRERAGAGGNGGEGRGEGPRPPELPGAPAPVTGRGAGKLLLFGEHAAVYGYPAVGLRLPRYLEVQLHGADRWRFPPVDARSADLIRRAVETLPGITGRPLKPCRIRIGGDLPMSVGLGSSAAFCIALIRAAARTGVDGGTTGAGGAGAVGHAAGDEGATLQELWRQAHALEHVFHGTPSGIDTGLSLLPGPSMIYPNPPGVPRAEPVTLPEGWLVTGAVPRVSSTADLVAGIRRRREADPAGTEEKLRLLGEIARAVGGLAGTAADGVADLGSLADRAQETLAGLGLSTAVLDEALDLLRRDGATGAKLSGAGGGGAFFGVFKEKAAAETAAALLHDRLTARGHALPTGPFVLTMPLYNSN